MSTCHRQTLTVSRNFVTSRCTVVLLGTSLPGYSSKRFICEVTNVRDWTSVLLVNTPYPHLQGFCATGMKKRTSNQGDLDSSVTTELGTVFYTGVDLLLISVLYRSTWWFLGCVLNGTLCRITKEMSSFKAAEPTDQFTKPVVSGLSCKDNSSAC
jgi:hypothetical protein